MTCCLIPQDQNENQSSHEIEILKGIMSTCQDMAVTSSHLVVGDVVSRASRRTPAKVSQHSMLSLTKYYLRHLECDAKHLADELVDFHAQKVNPKDLVVSSNFFQTLAMEPGFHKSPNVRHYLTITQYTKEKTRASAGQPDTAAFLDPSALINFSKCSDLVVKLEHELKSARAKYLPILERQLAPQQARFELACLGDILVRCAFTKAFPAHLRIKAGTGKLTHEKIQTLTQAWAKIIDEKFPDLNFSASAELQIKDINADAHRQILMEKVDAKSLGSMGEDGDDGVCDNGLKPGDSVTVIRRFTVSMELSDKSCHRKDINEGTKGLIKGYADAKHRQVLVEFQLNVPLKSGSQKTQARTIMDKTFPRNLQLTEVYEQAQATS